MIQVTVSIPVEISGYTGQRDALERHTYQMDFSREGDVVVLRDTHGAVQQTITFPLPALLAADRILRENQ